LALAGSPSVPFATSTGARPAATAASSALSPEQPPDIRPLPPQCELALVAPGEQQEVVAEPRQPLGLGRGVAHSGSQLLTAAARPRGELEFPAEHRQRSAQLVAGVDDQGALPGQGAL